MAKQLTALMNKNKKTIANSGATELAVMVEIEKIELDPIFENLFPLNEIMVEKIEKDIEKNGFDKSQPIHIWKNEETLLLIDGHHRRVAAKRVGLKEIPVFYHSFSNKDEALEYAILLQTNRRNLSDAEILKTLQTLDKLKTAGKKAIDNTESKGKSAEVTAKKMGVSRSKIEKTRTIENKATDEVKQAVASGDMSIHKAYNITMGKVKVKLKPLKLFICEKEIGKEFICKLFYAEDKESAISLLTENDRPIAITDLEEVTYALVSDIKNLRSKK